MEHILALQEIQVEANQVETEWGHGGLNSTLSLLLCGIL